MAFPVYTADDVATFSGRPVGTYPVPFSDMAILQATVLFQYASALDSLTGDPLKDNLLKFGILSMADHLILQQPYQQALASPFNSEHMGSYSYMKTYMRASQAATAVTRGEATGVMFFDLAVAKLGVYDAMQGIARGGGTEIFEHDGIFYPGGISGNTRFLGPAELDSITHDLNIQMPVQNPLTHEPVVLGGSPVDEYATYPDTPWVGSDFQDDELGV